MVAQTTTERFNRWLAEEMNIWYTPIIFVVLWGIATLFGIAMAEILPMFVTVRGDPARFVLGMNFAATAIGGGILGWTVRRYREEGKIPS